MKILITGATGFVGLSLLSRLVDENLGDDISVFLLTGEDLPDIIKESNMVIHYGNITEQDSIDRAINGQDVVIHLAGYISYWKSDLSLLKSINVEGVRNVVASCLKYGVRRLIHISSVGAVGFNKDGTEADENTKYNWSDKFPYMTTKKMGEEIVLDAVREHKLNAVILNPASIMGPGDPNILSAHNQIYSNIYSSPFFWGSFSGGLAVVDVRDLCNAILQAIQLGKKGERFLIIGANIPYSRVLKSIGKYAGKMVFPVLLPPFLFIMAGWFMEFISGITRKRPLMTAAYGRLSGWFAYYSNEKSRKKLNITYRDVEETIADDCMYFANKFVN